MTPAALDALLRVALPPLKLALRERYFVVRREDPAAALLAAQEVGDRRTDPCALDAARVVNG
jgi:hypothetical protein